MMCCMGTGDDWRRLAAYTRDRRGDLGLTQEELAAAGGPSTATLRLIEGARQPGYRPAILRALERALQWERGSVRAILDGGDPVSEADDLTLPGISPAPVAVTPAAADPLTVRIGQAIEARYAELATEIGDQIAAARRRGKPEDQIFANPYEQALWAIPLMPEADRILRIAALRSMRPPSAPPNDNTSPPPPVELAGLAAWGAARFRDGAVGLRRPVLVATGDIKGPPGTPVVPAALHGRGWEPCWMSSMVRTASRMSSGGCRRGSRSVRLSGRGWPRRLTGRCAGSAGRCGS